MDYYHCLNFQLLVLEQCGQELTGESGVADQLLVIDNGDFNLTAAQGRPGGIAKTDQNGFIGFPGAVVGQVQGDGG